MGLKERIEDEWRGEKTNQELLDWMKREAAEADELMAEMSGSMHGLLEWCGHIAGDNQMEDEAAFEEKTVRCARAVLEKYKETQNE